MPLSRLLWFTAPVAAFLAPIQGRAAVDFTEIARFDVAYAFKSDLDPTDQSFDDNEKYIGTNPLAVAWNGSKLYLGGYDNFGASLLPIGITEVLNATSTGMVTVGNGELAMPFGQIAQPSGRGYTGLAIHGDRVAASYDNGNATTTGIQLFDTSTHSLIWDLGDANTTGHGSSGVAFDPGHLGGGPGAGAGVAWTTFGNGRRALQDVETGASVWGLETQDDPPPGMFWITSGAPDGVNARDMTFDPTTGDVYVRRANDVDAAERSGANETVDRRTLVDAASGNFAIGGHIDFLNTASGSSLLIYNDNANLSGGKEFLDVVKVVDTSGAEQTANFELLGAPSGEILPSSNGVYDFDFDPVSQTMAIMDFTNLNVHIFTVEADPPGIDGDYNGDGVVDAADYVVWRDSLGASVILVNDTTPGMVTAEDYGVWAANYGASLAPVAAAAAPEPTGLALMLGAAVIASARRSRRA